MADVVAVTVANAVLLVTTALRSHLDPSQNTLFAATAVAALSLYGLFSGRGPFVASTWIFYAAFLFAGIGPWIGITHGYYGEELPRGPANGLDHTVALTAVGFQVGAVLLTRRSPRPTQRPGPGLARRLLSGNALQPLVRASVVLFALTGALILGQVDAGALPGAMASSAATGLAVAGLLAARARQATRFAVVSCFAGAAILLYVTMFFRGYGRLTVAAAGFAVMAVVAPVYTRIPWRAVVTAVLIPGLVVSSAIGVARAPVGTVAPDSGLLSLVSPVSRLSELIALRPGGLEFEGVQPFGATFLVALLVWIPSSLWEGKPEGFGRILVYELDLPRYEGHSEAALLTGELYYAWGWLGVLLGGLAVALAIRSLDRVIHLAHARLPDRAAALRWFLGSLAAAGMLDLFWGGAFLFASRMGLRIAVLGGALWAASAHYRGEPEQTSAQHLPSRSSVATGNGARVPPLRT